MGFCLSSMPGGQPDPNPGVQGWAKEPEKGRNGRLQQQLWEAEEEGKGEEKEPGWGPQDVQAPGMPMTN